MAAPSVKLAEIQGLIYSGYKKHAYAGFLFATLGEAAASRAWLRELKITSAEKQPGPKLHIAFSAHGLGALGVPDDVIDGLPNELKLGMINRDRVLGDTPSEWTLGGPDDELDVVLLVYTESVDERTKMMADQRKLLVDAGATVRPDELTGELSEQEHFGFRDGLSQPFVAGLHQKPRPHERQIALGELLLGYENAYGKIPVGPRYTDFDLGINGTYLVFRKLAQDVGALWTYLEDQAPHLDMSSDKLGAKLLGRWRNGTPLVVNDTDDTIDPKRDLNDFVFLDKDPDGLMCPIAAHIRRANPRDARDGKPEVSLGVVDRHRMLRRGRSWGPPLDIDLAKTGRDDKQPRGLYFLGLGASISRGFEFIQQSWLNNPTFHGLQGENDPVTGPGGCPFTIPDDPIRKRLLAVPKIVTTLGGGYFFMPSLAAIARIASDDHASPRL